MVTSPQIEVHSQVNPRVYGSGGSSTPLNGVSSGRPPDVVWPAIAPPRLERLANSVNVEDQQVVKRSRGEGDDVMDIGVGEVLGTALAGSMDANGKDKHQKERELQQGSAAPAKPSFRDMLVGRSFGSQPVPNIPELELDAQYFSEVPGHGQFKVAMSSFAVLSDDENDNVPREEGKGPVDDGIVEDLSNAPRGASADGELETGLLVVGNVEENRLVDVELRGRDNLVVLQGSGSDSLRKVSNKSEMGGSTVVASKDEVVYEPINLKSGTHVVVRVSERGSDLVSKKGGGRRFTAGLKDGTAKGNMRIGGAKGGEQAGTQIRKNQSIRPPGKVGLNDWVGSLDRDLESSMVGGGSAPNDGGEQHSAEYIDVQWKDNVSFDRNS
ncbi:hypothetical protein V6N12_031864 [Hibiscus sabdariffa]|uniref:Uncharacterized protein n=1 Tax=Hibiscus sabdariffa TaxID=183260 RepID=A0ABR2BYE1_9ROSI